MMRSILIVRGWRRAWCTIFFVLALVPSLCQAGTLTFDEFSNVNGEGQIGNYGGLTWSSDFYWLKASGSVGYLKGMVSSENVAYNGYARDVTVYSASRIDFNSVFLTAAWRNDVNVRVKGQRSGVDVYDVTVFPLYTAPTLFNFNFLDVDSVTFSSFGGTQAVGAIGVGSHFAMDNFTFNSTPATVPEPSMMIIASLFGIGGYIRKRRLRK